MHTVTKTDRSRPLVLVVLLAGAALFCAFVAWAGRALVPAAVMPAAQRQGT
jgi:hypothetical protein